MLVTNKEKPFLKLEQFQAKSDKKLIETMKINGIIKS